MTQRAIKFRGKEKETGRWIYGFYVKHQTHTLSPIIPKGGEKENPEFQHLILRSGFSDWNMEKPLDMHEVEEDSVGEWTGLLDKNGVGIFEGDILTDSDGGGLLVSQSPSGEWMYGEYSIYDEQVMAGNNTQEVIGNIYEHPSLVKP